MVVEFFEFCLSINSWGSSAVEESHGPGRLGSSRLSPWRFALASVIGSSHVQTGVPCQDASDCRQLTSVDGESILVAVASDGAGSARHSRIGAMLACEFFLDGVDGVLRQHGRVQDLTTEWFLAWMVRFQRHVETVATAYCGVPRDFASTLSAAIIGENAAALVQVGDGAVIVASNDDASLSCVLQPFNGEYANTTTFLTDPSACETSQHRYWSGRVEDVAIITDGLGRIALDMQMREAHAPFFRPMFNALSARAEGYQRGTSIDLKTFLGSARINQRVDDDKTLIVATRRSTPGCASASGRNDMAQTVYYDAQGNRIVLGPKLGEGGEGAVFEVHSSPERVVKIYHANALTSIRRHKLQAMIALRDEKLQRIAAWPIATVSPMPSAPAVGFIMQKIDGCAEVHELYTPISRRQSFPDAQWKFLIHTSLNLSRAVKIIHNLGIVIGDINEKNVRVSSKSLTRFIDCDSYQINDGMRTFTCDVGVETFTPPELQGQSFAGKVRTQNHDAFGLAVMIFQLLFMGRHPFVGVPRDGRDMTIAQSIKAFRFAYGRQAGNRQVSAPPGTLSLEATGPALSRLFERAFAPEGVHARPRPSAAEWVVALQDLFESTHACARKRAHAYHMSLPSCPWCAIEAATGVTVWILPMSNVQASTTSAAPASNLPDFTSIWHRIASAPSPGTLPPIPGSALKSPEPIPEAVALAAQLHHHGKMVGGTMIAAAFLIWAIPLGYTVVGIVSLAFVVTAVVAFSGGFKYLSSHYSPFREALETSTASWTAIEAQWRREAGPEEYDQVLGRLTGLRDKATTIRNSREARVAQLRRDEAVRHRNAFLGRYTIDQASINGIGPSRKTTLRSFGIATALDVDQRRIQSVPGFGPELSNRLMLWRRSIETRHVFDPLRDVPASAIASIDTDIQNQLALIGRELSNGVNSLEEARRRIESRRAALQQRAIETRAAYLQAQANINVF